MPGMPPESGPGSVESWAVSLRTLLVRLRGRRMCIVGMGNRMRGDDAAGALVVEGLKNGGRIPSSVLLVDAGEAPENHLERIVKHHPAMVLFVDAAWFEGDAGECRLLEAEGLSGSGISTHAGAAGLVAGYLRERLREVEVVFLCIRAGDLTLGAAPSARILATVGRVCSVVTDALGRR